MHKTSRYVKKHMGECLYPSVHDFIKLLIFKENVHRMGEGSGGLEMVTDPGYKMGCWLVISLAL